MVFEKENKTKQGVGRERQMRTRVHTPWYFFTKLVPVNMHS